MSTFWALAGLLLVLAMLFTVVPLLRRHTMETVDHDRLNAAVVKEQLNELQADLEAGKLDQDAYSAARHDLERDLLSNLEGNAADAAAPPRQGRWAAGLFALLVPGLAVLVYLQLGAPDYSAREAEARATASTSGDAKGHPLAEMVEVLAQRLREQPDRLDGWLLLARSYGTLQRFDESVEALAQARRIAGDTPELLIDSADMQTMANGGRFTDEVGGLLQTALRDQPDNAKGRWLLGHYYYQRNELKAAIDSWQQAAASLPANSESLIAINQQIARARGELGETAETTAAVTADAAAPEAAGSATGTAAAYGAAIQVSVDMDPALRASAAPGDTLFVYARATQGPRMPLAIVRKQVADLPLTVTLDDSQAMTPAMVLSNFEEVTVGARISKSGNAMPQPGDLEGIRTPVRVGKDDSIDITIDRLIP